MILSDNTVIILAAGAAGAATGLPLRNHGREALPTGWWVGSFLVAWAGMGSVLRFFLHLPASFVEDSFNLGVILIFLIPVICLSLGGPSLALYGFRNLKESDHPRFRQLSEDVVFLQLLGIVVGIFLSLLLVFVSTGVSNSLEWLSLQPGFQQQAEHDETDGTRDPEPPPESPGEETTESSEER